MSFAFSIDFLEPTSEFQTHVTFLLVDKNTRCGYSFSKLDMENFGYNLSGFAEISLSLLRPQRFQFWPTLHVMQRHH